MQGPSADQLLAPRGVQVAVRVACESARTKLATILPSRPALPVRRVGAQFPKPYSFFSTGGQEAKAPIAPCSGGQSMRTTSCCATTQNPGTLLCNLCIRRALLEKNKGSARCDRERISALRGLTRSTIQQRTLWTGFGRQPDGQDMRQYGRREATFQVYPVV